MTESEQGSEWAAAVLSACLWNEWARIPGNPYDVHKSAKLSDGKTPFGNPEFFVAMAELPTGQVILHHRASRWSLFNVPVKPNANQHDGHDLRQALLRLETFAQIQFPPRLPKPE